MNRVRFHHVTPLFLSKTTLNTSASFFQVDSLKHGKFQLYIIDDIHQC